MTGPGYYDRFNPDILSRIPVGAKIVLEFGCGSGALGEAYKSLSPTSTYVGVECAPGPVSVAAKRLDRVISANIETLDLNVYGMDEVDCLIYGDVLEHLRNPQRALESHLKFLSAAGKVLICIPNVQHWSVLFNLLNGSWPQNDEGLFDRDHVRWFTRASMEEMLSECGLVVEEVFPRVFDLERPRKLVDVLAPALPKLGLSSDSLMSGISPLQYVFVASSPCG